MQEKNNSQPNLLGRIYRTANAGGPQQKPV